MERISHVVLTVNKERLRRNPSGNRVILILVGQKSSTRII